MSNTKTKQRICFVSHESSLFRIQCKSSNNVNFVYFVLENRIMGEREDVKLV